jgi:hypothetical protein
VKDDPRSVVSRREGVRDALHTGGRRFDSVTAHCAV